MHRLSLIFLTLSVMFPALSQRLPNFIHPEHYDLVLTPDLKSATFKGEETIDALLSTASNTITLNAAELEFQEVTLSGKSGMAAATVSVDATREQAVFTFARPLPAGRASLHIRYSGVLNNELRGFYLSKTSKRNYAVTQFEPTDARRAFPCFDEPALKATYNVSLVVDIGDTAISNTNIVYDKPLPASSKHLIRFATTPLMSTYLVAFLVGDFKCASGQSDGVPIHVCATPDKVATGKFAITAAEFALHYFNNYFGIKYPLPKLDMIAIPDFEAGAMENFGAITYRETDLLIDETTASADQKKRVAVVVAHELAHQWFGDLVTMQWWNNVWLNEGFASWMENKPVNAWKPEWGITQDEAVDLDQTLNYDAQPTTRTIRATADTPDQINQMFDGISYGKGGAILAMLEHYLGEETFRRGVHQYLAKHLYANATAEDFLNAQVEISQRPVDQIMSSFIAQPGVPLLEFAPPEPDKLELMQSRFFLSPRAQTSTHQTWTIPVCFKAQTGNHCELVSTPYHSLPAPRGPILFANAGGRGYYRVLYPASVYHRILSELENTLTPEERLSFAGDEWAMVSAERTSIGDYLDLIATLRKGKSAQLINSVSDHLRTIYDYIATDVDREKLSLWLRAQFEDSYDGVRKEEPNQSPNLTNLRAALLRLLGSVGRDPKAVAEARQTTTAWLQNPASVEPALASAALDVSALEGDAVLYDRLLNLSQTARDPHISREALFALVNFYGPALVRTTLELACSGRVRNQDSAALIARVLEERQSREIAWEYIRDNWEKIKAQLTTSNGSRLVAATGAFCSVSARDQVSDFFSKNRVTAVDRALKRAIDHIDECVELVGAQQAKLHDWLSQHSAAAGVSAQ